MLKAQPSVTQAVNNVACHSGCLGCSCVPAYWCICMRPMSSKSVTHTRLHCGGGKEGRRIPRHTDTAEVCSEASHAQNQAGRRCKQGGSRSY